MNKVSRRQAVLLLAAPALVGGASRRALVVMVSGGFHVALERLAPEFESSTGLVLRRVLGASMGRTREAIPARLARREPADAVILARRSLDDLVAAGLVAAGSEVDLVRSRIAMAVRAGAPRPSIATVDDFRRALLAAKSVAYSDSASGVYLSRELFPRLGLAADLARKAAPIAGRPVGRAVASGEYEIGFQQLSELLPIPGIDIVGLLPPDIQRVTVFSGGVTTASRNVDAARSLLAFLSSPAAAAAIRQSGLEPA